MPLDVNNDYVVLKLIHIQLTRLKCVIFSGFQLFTPCSCQCPLTTLHPSRTFLAQPPPAALCPSKY